MTRRPYRVTAADRDRGVPTLADLADDLAGRKAWLRKHARTLGESDLDVRLQIDGATWITHVGLADYDQDHRGAWAATVVTLRSNIRALARALRDEALDALAEADLEALIDAAEQAVEAGQARWAETGRG
jgi:hypothetical protein